MLNVLKRSIQRVFKLTELIPSDIVNVNLPCENKIGNTKHTQFWLIILMDGTHLETEQYVWRYLL